MDIRNFFGNSGGVVGGKQSTDTSSIKTKSNATGSKSQNNEKQENFEKSVLTEDAPCKQSSSFHGQDHVDVNSLTSKTVAIGGVTWSAGETVPYSALVETFESVSAVSGRLEKESLFCNLFQAVIKTSPSDLHAIVYLSSNSLNPAYEGMELGIGDSILVKAICEATGRTKAAVDEAYEREGDLGTVALASRTSQKTLSFAMKSKPLSATYILDQLRQIAQTKGDKAQGRKVERIKAVMVKCQGYEAKYFVRSLQGKLRIGTAAQTVLVALAQAFAQLALSLHPLPLANEGEGDLNEDESDDAITSTSLSQCNVEGSAHEHEDLSCAASPEELLASIDEIEPAEARELREHREGKIKLGKERRAELAVIAVKRAFSECPSITLLIHALLNGPLHTLYRSCRLVPGVPVHPMLAKPTKEIGEVLRRLSGLAFTMEYKYDGERAQVHLLSDGTVKIFSRNSEDNSEKYPDLKEIIKKAKIDLILSFVMDAEVVAYDREKGCLLPFQILSTRKRKMEEGEDEKVKVVLQGFDLLSINGRSLLALSLRRRRQTLRTCFTEIEGLFEFAKGADHVENGDTAPIEGVMQDACAAMCEGLMVKTLDFNATYEPSKRSLNWLKLKKDYIDGMGVCDSVDLVVIGGYKGRGKRTNVYGAYLMACYDPDRDEFQSCCKVGTGFKDEDLTRLNDSMKPYIIESSKRPHNYNVGDPLVPDDWFQAYAVWELQAADLSKSSVHKAGIGRLHDAGRGVGLRFPRFLRERSDKKAEQATTSEQIVDMYFSQGESNGEVNNGIDDDDELI